MAPLLQSESQALLNALVGDERSDQETNGSVFYQLRTFLGRKDAALNPSPTLNSILSRLVSLLQGNSCAAAEAFQGRLFSEVQQDVCREIDENKTLCTRAEVIRDVAMNAEFRLELHHVKRMLLKKGPQAELGSVEKLRIASDSFPYVEHYIDMVKKESEVIEKFLLPNDHKEGQTSNTNKHNFTKEDWKGVVVFCGSGPLPFTGILMAIFLKMRVVLIDCDEDAVDLSRKLILHWERENVIPPRVVTVIHAKGEELSFYNPDANMLFEPDEKMVPCHILFIAGLISNDVKQQMVRKISKLEHAGPLVVMRTAHGLTARFAYHKTKRITITKYLSLIGIVAPETHRDRNGLIIDDDVRPIDFFPSSILNSLELYSWRQDDLFPST